MFKARRLILAGAAALARLVAVGAVTFETAPVVAGATLVVDGDGVSGCDLLSVEGPLDVQGLRLRVADFSRMTVPVSVLVEAAEVTGTFGGTNVVKPDLWRLVYRKTEIALAHSVGTLRHFR